MPKPPDFKNEKLCLQALTHRSYVNEHPGTTEDNERLEFLGDAVLGFLVGELLYRRYPYLNEAQLTRLRSKLVDETQLAQIAIKLGIGEMMQLGKGAIKDGGRQNPALLSDTLEAIIGAYFLDAGIKKVGQFIQTLFQSLADSLVNEQATIEVNSVGAANSLIDVKNRLQQWSLAVFKQNPEYFLIKASGLDHAKEYTFGVRINGEVRGIGKGQRKQDATKAAAEDALKNLGLF